MHLGEGRWSKVPCQRKQLEPTNPEFEVLTTRPHTLSHAPLENVENFNALLGTKLSTKDNAFSIRLDK